MTAGRKVLVHVGTPKTGTSYVQDLLFQNRDALARIAPRRAEPTLQIYFW